MNGAESMLATAEAAGAAVCFANPGTTEMPLVEALDGSGIRPVLGLSEGVVTGAADGYSRMSSTPPMTLLHLGPGFANGIANLHNARRARSPVVNIVGEHASWHQHADPPLACDIESLARPVSGWVARTGSVRSVGTDLAEAWTQALRQQAPSTLIAASDHLWSQGGSPATVPAVPPAPRVDEQHVAEAVEALSRSGRTALLLGGGALTAGGIRDAARIAGNHGAEVLTERSPARVERGPSVPQPRPLPYFPEDQLKLLDEFAHLILVGADKPVSFFGYPGMPSVPIPEATRVHCLAAPGEDAPEALRHLLEATGSAATAPMLPEREQVPAPEGALDASAVAAAIVHTQPENTVLVNEGITASAAYPRMAAGAPAHTELALTGGAIGMGIPVATGAALACPDRPVIDLQADGSGFYTLQGLWTQAREGLNVTTVVCANQRYGILEAELQRAGVNAPGSAASALTGLGGPAADWSSLAAGFGVPGVWATTGEELVRALRRAHAEPGPHLIEARM